MEMVNAKKNIKVKSGKNPDGTDHVIEIPTKYKKFASYEEAVTDAGSAENVLSYLNASVKADSATPVRNYKPAEGQADEDVITKASVLREGWSIKDTIRDGLSQKEKAETLDEVTRLLESGASREELLAAIQKARGAVATPVAA